MKVRLVRSGPVVVDLTIGEAARLGALAEPLEKMWAESWDGMAEPGDQGIADIRPVLELLGQIQTQVTTFVKVQQMSLL